MKEYCSYYSFPFPNIILHPVSTHVCSTASTQVRTWPYRKCVASVMYISYIFTDYTQGSYRLTYMKPYKNRTEIQRDQIFVGLW